MASQLKKTNANQRRFQDPIAMFVTPYGYDADMNLNLGEITYDIHDIVGDTISLTQDDPDKTEIPWEFGDDPLDTNVNAGAKNFTCQCLDFQDDILKALFGCKILNGATIWPTGYEDLYVYIRVVFDKFDLVLPYVKMDSKTTLENMRSDIARGELSGTLMSKEITIAGLPTSDGQQAPSGTNKSSTNTAETPMAILPNSDTNAKAAYITNISGTGSSATTSLVCDYRDVE